MKGQLEIPRRKRVLPWIVGLAAGAVVWAGLLFLTETSGTLAIYVGFIVGFNAGAFVAAGLAKPVAGEEEGLFIDPFKS